MDYHAVILEPKFDSRKTARHSYPHDGQTKHSPVRYAEPPVQLALQASYLREGESRRVADPRRRGWLGHPNRGYVRMEGLPQTSKNTNASHMSGVLRHQPQAAIIMPFSHGFKVLGGSSGDTGF
jgi:hypothetical protein